MKAVARVALQLGAMHLGLANITDYLIGKAAHEKSHVFEGCKNYPLMRVRHVEREQRLVKK